MSHHTALITMYTEASPRNSIITMYCARRVPTHGRLYTPFFIPTQVQGTQHHMQHSIHLCTHAQQLILSQVHVPLQLLKEEGGRGVLRSERGGDEKAVRGMGKAV